MTATPTPAEAVTTYARGFLAATPRGHAVTSPLGAWLLRALTAGPAEDGARARDLLAHPHPLVRAAVAMWSASDVETDDLRRWRTTLPAADAGPIPDQARADAWASDATDGMVPRFPLALDPTTILVLANALATRVSWHQPLIPVSAAELAGPFAARVEQALSTAFREGQRTLLVDSPLGTVAAQVSEAVPADEGAGLAVVSVLGPPDAPAAAVHSAALELAAGVTTGGVREVDLFDAPASGPGWTVESGTAQVADDADRVVRASAFLPAWSARTDLDLLPGDGSAYGIDAAVAALAALLPPGVALAASARQSAYAAFGRTGFEAAAVSAVAIARGAPMKATREVPSRTLVARFGHPYAVCAVATGAGPWHGVPVFSAWVEDPEDPSD